MALTKDPLKSAFSGMKQLTELLSAENGVLLRRSNRSVQAQLDYAVRRGELNATLPGIYTAPDPSVETRVRAASMFRPDAVITGAAAARLLWWPEITVDRVECAVRHPILTEYPGCCWAQRVMPPEFIVHRSGVQIATPALSILDLIPVRGAAVVDEGLRRGAATLAELWEALRMTSHRPGNAVRRTILHDSRDEPWSPKERTAHQLLRAAGLTGWRTNHPVWVNGVRFVVDLVFLRERVVVEIDGWTYHNSHRSFVEDRWRYARLGAAGWTVLPIAGSSIDDDPEEFVAVVRQALRTRGRKF